MTKDNCSFKVSLSLTSLTFCMVTLTVSESKMIKAFKIKSKILLLDLEGT